LDLFVINAYSCFLGDYGNLSFFVGLEYTDDKRDDFHDIMDFVIFVDFTGVIGMRDHIDFFYDLDGDYVRVIDYVLIPGNVTLGGNFKDLSFLLHALRKFRLQFSIGSYHWKQLPDLFTFIDFMLCILHRAAFQNQLRI